MQKEATNDFQIVGKVNLKDNVTEGGTVNLKAEAQKAKGYLFRGDGLFQPMKMFLSGIQLPKRYYN